jgi:Domain of unknown function (DUF4426)
MRNAHKVGVLLLAIALLIVLLLLPRHGQGAQAQEFGDYIVHYNAIATSQLQAAIAKQYGIERSEHRGLLNIAVENKRDGAARMVNADVRAEVSDLTGHKQPIALRETEENGDVDYLGDFPLSGSGAYIFTVKVTPPGHTQPFVVRFNQDYVVD